MAKLKITFAGGANTATGSNFILEVGDRRLMIDCGLYQGEKMVDEINRQDFSYDLSKIDALFVTHGHLDHVGRIPKLYNDGYIGPIYSTPPTRDIGELIMMDSLSILSKDSEREGTEPIYEEKDVLAAIHNWHTQKYHEVLPISTSEGVLKVRFLDAGHIMGSSMVEFEINGKKIVFTGDLGNTPSPLLKDTEEIKDVTYLVMESVYGDRNHEDQDFRIQKLKDIINKTIKRGGTLMIPAFSIERTQEILYYINDFVENGLIPKCPIYLDSPLGINATAVYKKYQSDYMNTEVNSIIKSGDDIFSFKGLTLTKDKKDSQAINDDHGAKIIIAGSGMSSGGRIIHHEMRYLSDPKATLLMVGYQAVGTLGRRLQDGDKTVVVHGQEVKVKCEVDMIGGFSAHKDSDHLLGFVESSAESIKKVFIVLGEPKSSMFLGQRIVENYGLDITLPELGETVELDI
ncbi:MAG: metallo-beta-lactamase family protein [Patescibacteria group bacterium]|nr:metallo-beta-lactamase family protein [Patescibacteria group bacterium]